MSSSLRWKLVVVIGVLVLFAAVGIYPIAARQRGVSEPQFLMAKQLKLGLDLEGGVHLVLRVETDDALRSETDGELERLREALRMANIPVGRIMSTGPSQFQVEGVSQEQDAAFLNATAGTQTNFDRRSGESGTYTFTLKPTIQRALRDQSVVQARQTVERRVNELGVAEPIIAGLTLSRLMTEQRHACI
jgi:preprotein translocase subunit SecD